MEIAPTSYLRVNGASIVDGSDTAVRLQGPCLGGWMNMENFIVDRWSAGKSPGEWLFAAPTGDDWAARAARS